MVNMVHWQYVCAKCDDFDKGEIINCQFVLLSRGCWRVWTKRLQSFSTVDSTMRTLENCEWKVHTQKAVSWAPSGLLVQIFSLVAAKQVLRCHLEQFRVVSAVISTQWSWSAWILIHYSAVVSHSKGTPSVQLATGDCWGGLKASLARRWTDCVS